MPPALPQDLPPHQLPSRSTAVIKSEHSLTREVFGLVSKKGDSVLKRLQDPTCAPEGGTYEVSKAHHIVTI